MAKTSISNKTSDSPEDDQKNTKNNFDDLVGNMKVEMTSFVQKNPLATVVLVGGLGVLLGRLIYKSKS